MNLLLLKSKDIGGFGIEKSSLCVKLQNKSEQINMHFWNEELVGNFKEYAQELQLWWDIKEKEKKPWDFEMVIFCLFLTQYTL